MGLFDSIGSALGSAAGFMVGGPIGALIGNKAMGSGAGGPGGIQQPGQVDLNNFGSDPASAALQKRLSGMTAPGAISAGSNPYSGADSYKAKDMASAALPEYDALRSRLNQSYSQNQGIAQDALDRQFAAAGGGPGNGAQAKQTENLATATEKQKGEDLAGINAQEAATKRELQSQESQKEFQSQEAQKGMQFQAGQSQAGRELSAQEYNSQASQLFNQFQFEGSAKIAGLDDAWKQAQAEANNNEFNKAMEEFKSQHSGGLLGSGGFLGTGFSL